MQNRPHQIFCGLNLRVGSLSTPCEDGSRGCAVTTYLVIIGIDIWHGWFRCPPGFHCCCFKRHVTNSKCKTSLCLFIMSDKDVCVCVSVIQKFCGIPQHNLEKSGKVAFPRSAQAWDVGHEVEESAEAHDTDHVSQGWCNHTHTLRHQTFTTPQARLN